jgi:diguanylate cyclase (GGDEF)-like protein
MCDIDHFKRINDKFGHPAGDRVLAMVARALDDGLRDGDVVARFGGEEFLVAAPGIGTTAAAALAERLRTRVAEASDAEVGGVTVSLGMALWDEGESMAELIERADLALYQAKEQGRNRVVCADPL